MNLRQALENLLFSFNNNRTKAMIDSAILAPKVEAALRAAVIEMAERCRYDILEHDLSVDIAASVTVGIAKLAEQT